MQPFSWAFAITLIALCFPFVFAANVSQTQSVTEEVAAFVPRVLFGLPLKSRGFAELSLRRVADGIRRIPAWEDVGFNTALFEGFAVIPSPPPDCDAINRDTKSPLRIIDDSQVFVNDREVCAVNRLVLQNGPQFAGALVWFTLLNAEELLLGGFALPDGATSYTSKGLIDHWKREYGRSTATRIAAAIATVILEGEPRWLMLATDNDWLVGFANSIRIWSWASLTPVPTPQPPTTATAPPTGTEQPQTSAAPVGSPSPAPTEVPMSATSRTVTVSRSNASNTSTEAATPSPPQTVEIWADISETPDDPLLQNRRLESKVTVGKTFTVLLSAPPGVNVSDAILGGASATTLNRMLKAMRSPARVSDVRTQNNWQMLEIHFMALVQPAMVLRTSTRVPLLATAPHQRKELQQTALGKLFGGSEINGLDAVLSMKHYRAEHLDATIDPLTVEASLPGASPAGVVALPLHVLMVEVDLRKDAKISVTVCTVIVQVSGFMMLIAVIASRYVEWSAVVDLVPFVVMSISWTAEVPGDGWRIFPSLIDSTDYLAALFGIRGGFADIFSWFASLLPFIFRRWALEVPVDFDWLWFFSVRVLALLFWATFFIVRQVKLRGGGKLHPAFGRGTSSAFLFSGLPWLQLYGLAAVAHHMIVALQARAEPAANAELSTLARFGTAASAVTDLLVGVVIPIALLLSLWLRNAALLKKDETQSRDIREFHEQLVPGGAETSGNKVGNDLAPVSVPDGLVLPPLNRKDEVDPIPVYTMPDFVEGDTLHRIFGYVSVLEGSGILCVLFSNVVRKQLRFLVRVVRWYARRPAWYPSTFWCVSRMQSALEWANPTRSKIRYRIFATPIGVNYVVSWPLARQVFLLLLAVVAALGSCQGYGVRCPMWIGATPEGVPFHVGLRDRTTGEMVQSSADSDALEDGAFCARLGRVSFAPEAGVPLMTAPVRNGVLAAMFAVWGLGHLVLQPLRSRVRNLNVAFPNLVASVALFALGTGDYASLGPPTVSTDELLLHSKHLRPGDDVDQPPFPVECYISIALALCFILMLPLTFLGLAEMHTERVLWIPRLLELGGNSQLPSAALLALIGSDANQDDSSRRPGNRAGAAAADPLADPLLVDADGDAAAPAPAGGTVPSTPPRRVIRRGQQPAELVDGIDSPEGEEPANPLRSMSGSLPASPIRLFAAEAAREREVRAAAASLFDEEVEMTERSPRRSSSRFAPAEGPRELL